MAGIDSFTKLMLHMDDTSLTDSEITPKTITLVGNVARSSTQYKFGGFSALFDGTGDRLSCTKVADFDFGSGDFTVDFWVYWVDRTTGPSGGFQGLCGNISSSLNGGICIRKTNTHVISCFDTSDTTPAFNFTSSTAVSNSNWYHMALVRSGTSFVFYLNGVSDGTTSGSGSIQAAPNALVVGNDGQVSGVDLNGYIDEFRVSKGIARWTSNFTPPTEAYDIAGKFVPSGHWGGL